MSGDQRFFTGREILVRPSHSSGSHIKNSWCQYCWKYRSIRISTNLYVQYAVPVYNSMLLTSLSHRKVVRIWVFSFCHDNNTTEGSEKSHQTKTKVKHQSKYTSRVRVFWQLWCPHHSQDSIQGEGDVSDGGITEVHCRSEWLHVKNGLHGLVGRAAVTLFTGQFTETNRGWEEEAPPVTQTYYANKLGNIVT